MSGTCNAGAMTNMRAAHGGSGASAMTAVEAARGGNWVVAVIHVRVDTRISLVGKVGGVRACVVRGG